MAERDLGGGQSFPTEPPEFTGVRRHYVFGLRSQLPVPDGGWTAIQHPVECGAPELTCEGLECSRALAASFWVTKGTDLQSARAMTDMFEAVLEEALRHPGLERPLDEADAATVTATVAPLYAVLDDPTTKPWNANATTLSKVLHRKRPHALVLHDRWVQACYLGDGGPVPRAEERSWADYMTAITTAIGHDIRTQRSAFEALDAATSTPGELTPVRLLDILAWMSQGETPSEAGSGEDPA